MKAFKIFFSFALFFAVFAGGLTFYYTHVSTFELSSKSPGKPSQKRTQELPKIISQVESIPNEPSALFNDPAINQAWGLKKSDAARAWSITQGSRDIIVAVIDTGLADHEDIMDNRWENAGEIGLDSKGRDKRTNGIDDDGNGYVDDVYGWNFVSNNNNLADNHGHGTHISGIIGAVGGNGKGIIGIAPQVSLMTLKYFDPKVPNTDNLKNTIAAINYAVKMGAHIINYSGGGTEFSQAEKDAVAAAGKKGILFVAAAGNEKSNSDKHPYYPADYGLPNIISVTAIDPSTEVLTTSNWGIETVDIAAPGQNILSLLPGNSYGYMTGTSQATAFVSGAGALVMTKRQSYKADEVKKYILATGDPVQSLALKTATSRKLNLFKSLTVLDGNVALSGIAFTNEKNTTSDMSTTAVRQGASLRSFGGNIMDAIQKSDEENKRGLKKPRIGQKENEF